LLFRHHFIIFFIGYCDRCYRSVVRPSATLVHAAESN